MTSTTAISPRARCASCKRTKAWHDKPESAADPLPCAAFVEKPKRMSRIDRWMEAASRASSPLAELRSALEDLNEVRSEYEEWYGNLPDNLQNGTLGEKLQAVIDIDLDSALGYIDEIENAIAEAENADLPRGFGKD